MCGRGEAAARYIPEFCRQLARCIEVEVQTKKEQQERSLAAVTSMSSSAASSGSSDSECLVHGCHNLEDDHEAEETEWEQYVDDRTGRLLDPEDG